MKTFKEYISEEKYKKGDYVMVHLDVGPGFKKPGKFKGKIINIHRSGDAADVDFGNGDEYGIDFKRMEKTK